MPGGPIIYGDAVNRRHPLNRGIVGWWPGLPGMSGGPRLLDIDGRNHGTLTNGPTWVPGADGFGALSFDGSDDEVAFAAIPGGERFPPNATGLYTAALSFWWTPAAWPPTLGSSGAPVQLQGITSGSHYPFTDGLIYLGTLLDTRKEGITSLYPDTSRRRVMVYCNPVANQWRLYENGRLTHGTTTPGYIDLGTTFAFGYGGTTAFHAAGKLEGVRVLLGFGVPAGDTLAALDYDQAGRGYPDLLRRRARGAVVPNTGGGAANNVVWLLTA